MSQRSLLEINHDYSPGDDDAALLAWARTLRTYIRSGVKSELPQGVVFKGRRHHADPDPMAGRGDPS